MKTERVLAVLFFSALWGVSEAVLGDALYSHGVPHASVPLTAIALVILTLASAYLPRAGMATLIACCAMLYKFLNTPFFGCHLLGIVLTGICYDVLFCVLKVKNKPLSAVLTVYTSFILFAVAITYIFRYEYWVQGGFAKVLQYVLIDGSVAAVICAALVPLSIRLGERAAEIPSPFRWRASPLAKTVAGVAVALWLLDVGILVVHSGL